MGEGGYDNLIKAFYRATLEAEKLVVPEKL